MKLWTVEYSISEDAYKMRHFDLMLEENRKTIERGVSQDYVLIGIAATYKEGRKLADMHALSLPEQIMNL